MKPYEPRKPIEPKEVIESNNLIRELFFEDYTLEELTKNIDVEDYKNVYIELDYETDYDGQIESRCYLMKKHSRINPNYDEELAVYNVKLKKYEKEKAKYDKELEAYNEHMAKIAKQQRLKQYEMLKKEFGE